MNRPTQFLTAVFAVGSLLLLAGCAKYKAKPLPQLSAYSGNKKGVSLAHRAFNVTESKMYLGRDIQKKGFQPLLLSITNNTDHAYQVSPSSLSMPIANADYVAHKLHTNTTGRAVGYGTAAVLSCGLFAIPAIVDGTGSSKANKQLDIDYCTKMLRLDTVIRPYNTLSGVVFVALGSYTSDFTFTITDADSGKKLVLPSNSGYVEIK